MQTLSLYNDPPAHQIGDGAVMIEIGDLYADEERKLLLRMAVSGLADLGLAQIASLGTRLRRHHRAHRAHGDSADHRQRRSGDELGDRVPDPTVETEKLFQRAQAEKLRASEAYEAGDTGECRAFLDASSDLLRDALDLAPAGSAPMVAAGLEENDELAVYACEAPPSFMSKQTRDSYHAYNRKSGRARRRFNRRLARIGPHRFGQSSTDRRIARNGAGSPGSGHHANASAITTAAIAMVACGPPHVRQDRAVDHA